MVEKDYWIMHCLWGLKQLGFEFHLKGGTSLSKGWGLLERCSEDIDVLIFPPSGEELPTGRNHKKPVHVEKRRRYFEDLKEQIKIPGIVDVIREVAYDDEQMRGAGIRLKYNSLFDEIKGVKSGILLEVGFDQTTPNEEKNISSWAYDRVVSVGVKVNDNRAKGVACYCPEYTFVEKLQAISTKFRQEQESGELNENQLRHYYDVDCLLKEDRVQKFIGTDSYFKHKKKRFRPMDEPDLTINEGFLLSDPNTLNKYEKGFHNIESLFYGEKPKMKKILENLKPWLPKL
ncbi:MAG: nucleotidyl transferase AbiEii/AbiGii toxin family protein [Bdellovibrionales bacterium]|nr:nucleotidyl transferase AbiEii/AbiGii toxin family protein [Bdellovibrionales bacterium]